MPLPSSAFDPELNVQRQGNRTFWLRFIDEERFDHPTAAAPQGSENWDCLDLPEPASWMAANWTNDDIGVPTTFRQENGE